MPLYVTNILFLDDEIYSSLLGKDGKFTFNHILPYHDVLNIGLDPEVSNHISGCLASMRSPLTIENLDQVLLHCSKNIAGISNNILERALKNKLEVGYLDNNDFYRNGWWSDAYIHHSRVRKPKVVFDTVLDIPKPILRAISKTFPDKLIKMKYTYDASGRSSGILSVLNGKITEESITASNKIALAYDVLFPKNAFNQNTKPIHISAYEYDRFEFANPHLKETIQNATLFAFNSRKGDSNLWFYKAEGKYLRGAFCTDLSASDVFELLEPRPMED